MRRASVVIDTRDPNVYRESHIPNAVNIRDIFTYLSTRGSGGYVGLVRHFGKVLGAAGLKPTDRVVIYEDAMDNVMVNRVEGGLF